MRTMILKADGSPPVPAQPRQGRYFDQPEIHEIVGGYFEPVELIGGWWMFVNEDGQRDKLSLNLLATRLYHSSALFPFPGNAVLGDVLICRKDQVR